MRALEEQSLYGRRRHRQIEDLTKNRRPHIVKYQISDGNGTVEQGERTLGLEAVRANLLLELELLGRTWRRQKGGENKMKLGKSVSWAQ